MASACTACHYDKNSFAKKPWGKLFKFLSFIAWVKPKIRIGNTEKRLRTISLRNCLVSQGWQRSLNKFLTQLRNPQVSYLNGRVYAYTYVHLYEYTHAFEYMFFRLTYTLHVYMYTCTSAYIHLGGSWLTLVGLGPISKVILVDFGGIWVESTVMGTVLADDVGLGRLGWISNGRSGSWRLLGGSCGILLDLGASCADFDGILVDLGRSWWKVVGMIHHDRPRSTPDPPKIHLRSTQDAPRSTQDTPKTNPRCTKIHHDPPKIHPRSTKINQYPPKIHPRSTQDPP